MDRSRPRCRNRTDSTPALDREIAHLHDVHTPGRERAPPPDALEKSAA